MGKIAFDSTRVHPGNDIGRCSPIYASRTQDKVELSLFISLANLLEDLVLLTLLMETCSHVKKEYNFKRISGLAEADWAIFRICGLPSYQSWITLLINLQSPVWISRQPDLRFRQLNPTADL